MDVEALALELDGVDTDVDEQFDAAVKNQTEGVTRCRRGHHHAITG